MDFADYPKYTFEGAVEITSQRNTRGTLQYWEGVKAGTEDPEANFRIAKETRVRQRASAVGAALKFPPEILGDVYGDPVEAKKRAQLQRALSHDQRAALQKELLDGWAQVAGDDKALKSAFSAMKEPAEPNAEAPDTPAEAPDTPVKVDLVVTESPTKDEPANAPPPSAFKRSMPTVPYSQCYTDVVSYGGVKNEAFTSISA